MDVPELRLPLGRRSGPSSQGLLDQLAATAWTCASINAAVCASFPPHLYVSTAKYQAAPRCMTQAVPNIAASRLREILQLKLSTELNEVAEHPLLDLINNVNPYMNSFDLWELTTMYQETIGSAFWYVPRATLGRPTEIWPLPAHLVTINPASGNTGFDYFFRGAIFNQSEIIHFRYPNPSDPYYYGLSPLRAAFAEVRIASSYSELKLARFDNRAAPDVIIAPKEPTGPDERDRLEQQWNNKFRRGGNGRVLISESDLSVQLLNGQMGDLALLAEKGRNSEDICNAFHVPLSMLSTNTNLANLQAADAQHASKCIAPRLTRRDQKLNEQLVPMFDPSRRLYFASGDPVPPDPDLQRRTLESAAASGWMTIHEIRHTQNLDPVPWGNTPCQPTPKSDTAAITP